MKSTTASFHILIFTSDPFGRNSSRYHNLLQPISDGNLSEPNSSIHATQKDSSDSVRRSVSIATAKIHALRGSYKEARPERERSLLSIGRWIPMFFGPDHAV
jgi:hypothetical protein